MMPVMQTPTLTFGDLQVGEKFRIFVVYANRKVNGVKTSETEAILGNDKEPGFVGRRNEVERRK